MVALPTWVQDGETKPAPGELLRVQAFVNTWDAETGVDDLAEPERARPWLVAAGLLGAEAPLGPGELAQARAVREALRSMLAGNAGAPTGNESHLEPIIILAGRHRLELTIDPQGRIELGPDPDDRMEDRLVALLVVVRDAQRAGTWNRLKVCGNPDCQWAFYDRSHSRQGTWCDMAVCGNVVKNRNLRARRRSAASPATGK